MRKLYDLIESQVRSLKALGFKAENYGPMLIPVVLSKLPNDIKLMISRKFDEDIWDAEAVLKILRKEIMAREKLSNIKLDEDEQREFPSSGSSLNAQAARTGTRKLFCSFCSGEHKSHECRTITKLETRKEIVLKNGRCFLCLRKGHMSRECKASFRCFHCKGKHHVALCEKKHNPNPPPSRSPKKNETENKDAESEDSSSNVTPANINIASDRNNVLLQTAMATVTSCDGNFSAKLRILFDSGSQLSYITPQARKKLNLKTVSKKELSIKVFGGEHSTKKLDLVKFEIKSTISNESINVSTFVNDICKPVSGQTINFAVENYEHLQGLRLADQNFSDDLHVDILIGADYYWNFFTKTVLRSSSGGPVAMGSKLGFILSGPVSTVSTTPVTANMACTHSLLIMKETQSDYEILNENVNKFFNLECLGISSEEPSIYDKFTDEIKFKDHHYEVRLLVKGDKMFIEDNYSLAKDRLRSQFNKLKNNTELLKTYDDIFKEQLDSGIIEKTTESPGAGETHYLPHRAVIKPNRNTTKVRIVFDASAKHKDSRSLNECLYTGPSLNTSLFGVLLRFRAYNIAITGDIEKAFHQISVSPEDRNLLRFIWYDDVNNFDDQKFENNALADYRFCRVVFGATCSPFLLSATLIFHLHGYVECDPQFVQKLLESLHVDDLTAGGVNDSDALCFYTKCQERLSEGGFNLRKFNSYSKMLENIVNSTQDETEIKFQPTIKVLGLEWNKLSDEINFNFSDMLKNIKLPTTKRNIMHFLASIYDPLGIINPIVVTIKVLFQDLCVAKFDWDQPLEGEFLQRWNEICTSFDTETLNIDRLYAYQDENDQFENIELHGFSDGSKIAYGCCVYIRFTYKSGKVKTALLSSKSRIKPLTNTTIPRIELLGTLVLARLMDVLKKELLNVYKIDNIFYWTDSTIAYSWIKNDNKDYKTFVQNRLEEIRKLTASGKWCLVPSKDNPADIVSRGCSPSELNSLWFSGPTFLTLPETHWPHLKPGDKFISDDMTKEEVRKEEKVQTSGA
ncbi:uncharacterized protein LOC130630070 [Hydractinia symbiolongicarpus]|uniref:uncharacterized protein LOC130630070 n=1 Tax=Hydractinia symbiolongicarpus TaxID=13093 RepID=UPI002550FC4A|nr:uncharacterized protein LOC130630070 [Hydractinia symbiolongicarpus]